MRIKKLFLFFPVLTLACAIGCGEPGSVSEDLKIISEEPIESSQEEETCDTKEAELQEDASLEEASPESQEQAPSEDTDALEQDNNLTLTESIDVTASPDASEASDSVPVHSPIDEWKENHEAVKGIYVTGVMAGTTNGMNNLITLLDETELNTMVIDVKNDEGKITFDLDDETADAIGAEANYVKDIDSLMAKLKEHNIYTIARIVCFKDPVLAAGRPDLALKTTEGANVAGGDGMNWVNPYKYEVWEYLVNIAREASRAGFDEVQFDYVRFPTVKNADYGQQGELVSKTDNITGFLSYATYELHNEGIVVGADLFGTVIKSEVDQQTVGQNYASLGSVADVLCPMVYPSHYANGTFGLSVPDANPYDTILGAMNASQEVLSSVPEEDRALIRPWLQSFTATWVKGHISYDLDAVKKEIQAVYDSGYTEWILWNAANKYNFN